MDKSKERKIKYIEEQSHIFALEAAKLSMLEDSYGVEDKMEKRAQEIAIELRYRYSAAFERLVETGTTEELV